MTAPIRFAPVLAVAAALAGCGNEQSALRPSGPVAGSQTTLTLVMVAAGALILLGVIALALYAIIGPVRRRGWLANERFVLAAGLVFPAVALTALLVYGLLLTRASLGSSPGDVRIEVTGEQFWWRVRYLDGEGNALFETANEIVIPAGRRIAFTLKSADVIHSFWVPNLAGKMDMVPGRVNRLELRADRPGLYRGQCAEYCGAQHARMAFYVLAVEAAEFEHWQQAQKRDAAAPALPALRRGAELFATAGCGACHAIRGTAARGTLGPDLTHMGSRRYLGAGLLPNNAGALAGWIASSQHLKPGNRMPSFDMFRGEELRTIAEYLANLK